MSSDDLTSFLIGSGAGFSVGLISGIFFALKAPNPKDVLLWNLYEALVIVVKNMPSEAKVAGAIILFVAVLFIIALKVEEVFEIIAGGVLGWMLGFVAGVFLVSNIQVLVWIAVIILITAAKLGWLKMRV